jgi:hypothetical protein
MRFVRTNFRVLSAFRWQVTLLWRCSLSRRSQRGHLTLARHRPLAMAWLPRPRILHPWPERRFDVRHPRWEPTPGGKPVDRTTNWRTKYRAPRRTSTGEGLTGHRLRQKLLSRTGEQDRSGVLPLGPLPETHPAHARLGCFPGQGRDRGAERHPTAESFVILLPNKRSYAIRRSSFKFQRRLTGTAQAVIRSDLSTIPSLATSSLSPICRKRFEEYCLPTLDRHWKHERYPQELVPPPGQPTSPWQRLPDQSLAAEIQAQAPGVPASGLTTLPRTP